MTLAITEACDLCGGAGWVGYENPVTGDAMGMDCPSCTPGTNAPEVWPDDKPRRCTICGVVTGTPPTCLTCEIELDAEFERRQDVAGPDWWAEP